MAIVLASITAAGVYPSDSPARAEAALAGQVRTHFASGTANATANSYFTIAVVPDTQNETRHRPAMCEAQMKWLSKNHFKEHIAMVLHEGDVVQGLLDPTQWRTGSRCLKYLDGKVPFIVAAGNHDLYRGAGWPAEPKRFNNLIAGFKGYSIAGSYRPGDYRNTFSFLTAGGVRFMVMNLEFGAPADVLAWAGAVADKYPSRHVIFLTHDYLSEWNRWRGSDEADADLPSKRDPILNNGIDMWRKFVSQHPNVQFTFSGHVSVPVSLRPQWRVGRLVSRNIAGRRVFQMLANFQDYYLGRGYLRLVRFYPLRRKVAVTTYSPYTDTFLRDRGNQFSYTGVKLRRWD